MENININTILSVDPVSVVLQGERNSTQSGKFTITNIGNTEFNCRSITKSCGCTMPEGIQAGSIIAPGASLDLTFTIDLKTPGTKYIYLFGNLEENISLPIHLNII